MAKKKKLISKKTKRKLKAAAPWAIAVATTGGMLAALAERGFRGRIRAIASHAVESVRPEKTERTAANGMANGMVSGMVPQESGAV